MKKGTKRKSIYKQMAFETAVRNPERYIGILTSLKDFEGQALNDKNLLEIVSFLYLSGEVSSDGIEIGETTKIEDIKKGVIIVNSTRRADGGFPAGYQSRFWTYMRTLSELGFVYAQYGKKFRFSIIAKKLINKEIDEQEAFSIQAMKYNRKSPFRNVSNDFNFFRFILYILLTLRDKKQSLSYEQFIVAMFSQSGDVHDFLSIIKKNKFKDCEDAYNFVKNKFGATTKFETVTQDYPDVVRRIMILSGFVTIRYSGIKLIQINENKIAYIEDLLRVGFELSEKEKMDAMEYFDKLNTLDSKFIAIAEKYRKSDQLDGAVYASKIIEVIKLYEINEEKICKSIEQINTRETAIISEFQEIPAPLKLEFYIAILIALKYGDNFCIRPNYKADHIGKPYSHAPGNMGDIDVYTKDIYWLIEVTLIRNKTQQLNSETTSTIRHLYSDTEFSEYSNKYMSLVAPIIHEDTKEILDISLIKNRKDRENIYIKPYNIGNFVDVTIKKENFADMEEYSRDIFENFRSNLNS